MSLSLTPRSGRAIGAADPRVGGPVTSMWSRENGRFPGINWGAERGVKDGVAPPFAIRGNADHRIDRYAIRATQTLTGPRVGNYARFINSTRSRTEKPRNILVRLLFLRRSGKVRSQVRYIRDTRLECRAESGERRRSLHFGNCRKNRARQLKSIARTHCGAGDVSLK
jgi:hypothetical protein